MQSTIKLDDNDRADYFRETTLQMHPKHWADLYKRIESCREYLYPRYLEDVRTFIIYHTPAMS